MKISSKIGKIFRSLLPRSLEERRGVLYFIPILIAVSLILLAQNKPGFESSFPLYADEKEYAKDHDRAYVSDNYMDNNNSHDKLRQAELFRFDPNTIDYEDLLRLGLTKHQAAGFVKYRSAGKRFSIPEEFAACFQISEEMYDLLKDYIVIAPQYQVKNTGFNETTPGYGKAVRSDSLFTFDPNLLTASEFASMGCFTMRQGEAIVNYREMKGGFRTVADFAGCYPVAGVIEKLKPYISLAAKEILRQQKIEINDADSSILVTIRGIGSLTADRIVNYRARLGGFYAAIQLTEVTGMTEVNYEKILTQITVDSCKIRKININFASLKSIENHPYLTGNVVRKILKNKQLKGGWSTLKDMIDDGTLTPLQAERLAPYLDFSRKSDK